MFEEASKSTAVESLIQFLCLAESGQHNALICEGVKNIQPINKALIGRKLPPLGDPCDRQQNCDIIINKSNFLRSYIIEKYINIEIIDEQGNIINEVKKIIPAEIEELPNAIYILLEKPLLNKGFLHIKGFSEKLGGEINISLNLSDFKS